MMRARGNTLKRSITGQFSTGLSHEISGFEVSPESGAVCPPTGLGSRQVAEAAGSGTRDACMQVCMRRQSFNDSNAVLLRRNRCR
jgi:hypothetical protein